MSIREIQENRILCKKNAVFEKKFPAVLLQEEENTLYYLRKKVNQRKERFRK